MNLKSVTVVAFQSKDLTGGEGEGERGREGEADRKGQQEGGRREDWRLFFLSIDLSPDSHWLLLNKGP